jgi:hypothetical protein
VRADAKVPPAVKRLIDSLGASPRWTGMKLEAGPDGIVVGRRSRADREWH